MIDIGDLIESKPTVRGGRPILAGTGVTVQRIIGWHRLGRSPQEIVDTFGHITLAQVHAALAFYYANQPEMDAAMAADEQADDAAEEEWKSR